MLNFIQQSQFRSTYLVAGVLAFVFLALLIFNSIKYQYEFVHDRGQELVDFSERALSRVMSNPKEYTFDRGVSLGDNRMQFVSNYQVIEEFVIAAPAKRLVKQNKINVFVGDNPWFVTPSDLVIIFSLEWQGQTYYSYFHNNTGFNRAELSDYLMEKLTPLFVLAALTVTLLFAFQLHQASKVNKVLTELADWADEIASSKKLKAPPQLQAHSMNVLANTLAKSVGTFSSILEQEHTFARFSSHEIRSKIAVLSANMDLLEVLMDNLSPDEKRVLRRMELSIEDMKYQTESLLWLSKEESEPTPKQNCALADVVTQAINDSCACVHPEQLQLVNRVTEQTWLTNPVLLQIVVNNLVRNAIQHTQSGRIEIDLHEGSLVIVNANLGTSNRQSNQGFGVGLSIVERICTALDVDYRVETTEFGRKVSLTLQGPLREG